MSLFKIQSIVSPIEQRAADDDCVLALDSSANRACKWCRDRFGEFVSTYHREWCKTEQDRVPSKQTIATDN